MRSNSKTRDCSLMVLIPRFGDKPRRRTIYIGTENTYTIERYHAALERAIEMRREAEEAYEEGHHQGQARRQPASTEGAAEDGGLSHRPQAWPPNVVVGRVVDSSK